MRRADGDQPFSSLAVRTPVAAGPRHSRRSLSNMNTHRAKAVKRLCWLLLVGIFVFHFWADGRNATLMHELQRHGATAASAREQLNWLCAPLNVAAVAV